MRWLVSTAIALSAALMTLLLAGPSDAFAASQPSTEHTIAIVKPSVVFIQTEWTGYLLSAPLPPPFNMDVARVLAQGGMAQALTVTTTCSGYIANPDGHVVTAGHCVDNQSVEFGGKGVFIREIVGALAPILRDQGLGGQIPAILTYAYQNWKVEGREAGSNLDRVVDVFPTVAASGIPVTTPLQANVLNVRPFNQGDLALLKVDSPSPLPALEPAPGSTPPQGTPVVAAGYPGSVTATVDPRAEPEMKTGHISSRQTVGGVPFPGISAPVSGGMSGGPVVDAQGRVVGVVSWSPGAETQPFNFMTDTGSTRDILTSAGVGTNLSATDQAYRSGLNNYFAGRYRSAVNDFNRVLERQPHHAQAQHYRTLAREKAGSGPNPLIYVLIAVGVLVVLAALAAVAVVLIRRSRRGAAAGGQPATGAPVTSGTTAQTAGGPATQAPATQAAMETPMRSGPPTQRSGGGFCPHCGAPRDSGARFCPSCGFGFSAPTAHGVKGSG